MLARHFLISSIGVMALATLPYSQEQVAVRPLLPVPPLPVWLLRVAPLSDDVSQLSVLSYSEEAGIIPAFINVTLIGKHGNADPKRLPIQTIQAWLLRADGTAVASMPKSFHGFPLSEPTTDIYPDAVSFYFVSVPAKELAGVVVSVNGKLYLREINGQADPTIRVTSTLSSADPIVKTTPTLPAAAKSAGVTGPVVIEITVDQSGNVTVGRVLRGDPLLNAAAEDAVKEWKYRPVLVEGHPVSVVLSVVVAFKDH